MSGFLGAVSGNRQTAAGGNPHLAPIGKGEGEAPGARALPGELPLEHQGEGAPGDLGKAQGSLIARAPGWREGHRGHCRASAATKEASGILY